MLNVRYAKRTNKVIVNYTSHTLCPAVTPFPLIGDAAYCQHAGKGPSHGNKQNAQKTGKDCTCGFRDILANKQTDTQTSRLVFTAQ